MFKKLIAFIICFSVIQISCDAFFVSGKSCIVICADTNQVLYGENQHKKMGMASTTKIMTAIVALEHGNTTDIVTISQNAAYQEGSSVYLKPGDKVSLCDLLYALMLNSGNDAAMAIAEHIAKTPDDFAALMNEKATALGCRNTHFKNPSGLPDSEHYSTTYDMALIMSYAMKNDEFAKIVATKEHQIQTADSVTYLRNHNKLLWQYPNCIGGKTGFTKASGRCFVSCANKDGVTLVCVTLDAPDDWNDHKTLLDFGFEKAEMTPIVLQNEILCTRKIRGTRLNILAGEDFSIPLKNGRKRHISLKVKLDETINGEINYGTHLGTGEIYVGNFLAGTTPLISGQSIAGSKQNAFSDVFGSVFKTSLLN
ncbi:MAG: D-alanyl-D-alanine carboxypeptidase [Clostridia bacterium]|nr:D-alanyl-D-alanine carboxypeptidase [Clostridia bacterium]